MNNLRVWLSPCSIANNLRVNCQQCLRVQLQMTSASVVSRYQSVLRLHGVMKSFSFALSLLLSSNPDTFLRKECTQKSFFLSCWFIPFWFCTLLETNLSNKYLVGSKFICDWKIYTVNKVVSYVFSFNQKSFSKPHDSVFIFTYI